MPRYGPAMRARRGAFAARRTVGAALVLVGGAASGVGTGGGHMRLLVGAHFAIPVLEFLYFTLVIIA